MKAAIGEPSITQAWYTVLALVTAAFLCTMDRLVLNLLVDPIRADLGVSDTQFSLLQGLSFTVINSVAALPLGMWVDRASRRRILLFGVLVWSLATAGAGLSHTYHELLAARIFVGMGEAALWPVVVSVVADVLPPRQRGRAIGCVLLGQILGSGASLILTGLVLRLAPGGAFDALPLLRHLAPWRLVLVLWGALGLVAIVLLLCAREPVRRQDRTADTGLGPFFGHLWSRRSTILPLYLGACCISIGSYSLAAWVPAFFIRHFHETPAHVGPLLGLVGIGAGIAGTGLAGWLSDGAERRGTPAQKLTLMMGAALACLPGASLAFAPTVTLAIAIQGVSLLFFPIAGTVTIVALQDLVPNEMRGKAMAVLTLFSSMLGATLGPTLTAAVTQYVFRDDAAVGYAMTVVLIPALTIAALCFYLARRSAPGGKVRDAGVERSGQTAIHPDLGAVDP